MIVIELKDIYLSIEESVYSQLKAFVQIDATMPEAGGILMGYLIDDYSLVIKNISTPNSQDRYSRFSFLRSFKAAQAFLNNTFRKSKGKKIYLGEWHTHPENMPRPSSTDIVSFRQQLEENELNSSITFMLILGLQGLFVSSFNKIEQTAEIQILYSDILKSLTP